MRSSAKLKISTQDFQSDKEIPFSLWTGPSSPPFNHAQSTHKFNDSLPSSPSTPPEFEFGSISSLEIKDYPPVSPKFIATGYWGATVSSFDAHAPDTIAPLSHPIISTKQPSAPPPPSVRQLMAEEMHGEPDDDFSLDFYSAPQSPMRTQPRKSDQRPLSQDEPSLNIATRQRMKSNNAVLDTGAHDGLARKSDQRPLSQDESSLNIATRQRRKSNSAVLDTGAYDELATQKNQMFQSSKSESNSHSALWSPSFAWEKSEEENSGMKKQGSKSCMKWAFKDLLRRTVPSSKAEARYITKTMGASSSKKYLSSTKSNPNISPLASPVHSASMPTQRATRPSTPSRSPTYGPSTPAARRSPPRRPSTPGRTPAQTLNGTPIPSPPRSPLSPHAIHYQQNKAQSLELTRKTFLPYRQSLLGCLGGPGAFSPEQQVR